MKNLFFLLFLFIILSTPCFANRVVLDNVPRYISGSNVSPGWNGCTPTAAGSLMAYWDSQPGFENLYKLGDAQVYNGDGTWGTRRMVASQRYLSGDYTPPDSISSFLGTDSDGGTQWAGIAPRLKAFAEWDDTSVYDMKDSYTAITDSLDYLESSFDAIKAEIAAGRPVLLSMVENTEAHSVVAYGYDDSITFDIYDNQKVEFVTVPGFAVMDTWSPGSGDGSRWYNWEKISGEWEQVNVEEIFDTQGHEWWPYFEANNLFSGQDEWQVNGIHTVELVPTPEPTTIMLFALGGLMLRRKHKK